MTADPAHVDRAPDDPLAAARRALAVERQRTTDERDALSTFLDRVRDVDVVEPTPMQGPKRQLQTPQTTGLATVRDAYVGTVMSVPHYDEEYGDSYGESLEAEFGADVAAALAQGHFGEYCKQSVLAKTEQALAERVVDRDAEADKLFAMVTRHFRRALTDLHEVEKLDQGRDDLFEYYYACRQFERIADHAEKIARFALDPDAGLPADFSDRVVSLGNDARQIVDQAADVILADAGIEAAHLALEHRDELVTEIETLDRNLYDHDVPSEAHTAGLLLDSLRRTAEYGANVANISIQQVSRTETDE